MIATPGGRRAPRFSACRAGRIPLEPDAVQHDPQSVQARGLGVARQAQPRICRGSDGAAAPDGVYGQPASHAGPPSGSTRVPSLQASFPARLTNRA
jgi:hypothetical protein